MQTKQQLADKIAAKLNLESNRDAYQPEIDDLYFLYQTIREKSITSILEFGSGWSTYVLAIALKENYDAFGISHSASIRHPNSFQLLTIDASKNWQSVALARLDETLKAFVTAIASSPELIEINGVICHRYLNVPNFTPDFIYLDGPDHNQVTGEINGFSYNDNFTTPMSADILAIEPFLWPETLIVTDGRTANARFLSSRLKRNWQYLHDPFGDRAIFRLEETAFGTISEDHILLRKANSRKLSNKEVPEGIPESEILK